MIAAVLTSFAQPQKSRVQNARRQAQAAQTVDRAALMFPTAVAVPEEVTWRRDIYRTLDLTRDENAALYYPVEPQDGEVNLFTLLFQLLNKGKIPAYEYQISGVENFNKENRLHFKDMLDKYGIYYEIDGNSINVDNSDVPSGEVLSYNIKESSYYDQNTATYHSRVIALCPVLHRSDDFSFDNRKYPMFWVKIEDIESYLSQHNIMISNVNNAARMSMADFFATNKYKGDIYMTTNMQNRTLQQYCVGDSAIAKEQKRIEKEMVDFEQHIWKEPVDSAALALKDSLEAQEAAAKAAKKPRARTATASNSASRTSRRSSSSSSAAATKKEKPAKATGGNGGSSPRVTVRRQRH